MVSDEDSVLSKAVGVMEVSRTYVCTSVESFNGQIFVVDEIDHGHVDFLAKSQRVKINSTVPGHWIVFVVYDHEDIVNNFGMVDCCGLGGKRTQCERFVTDQGCNVCIDLISCFT